MSELTNLLLNFNRREGCNSVRVGSEPASGIDSSVDVDVFWSVMVPFEEVLDFPAFLYRACAVI